LPFNTSATAEASDFKFGTWLGFAKGPSYNHTHMKSGVALGQGNSPKILEFPNNISVLAEASNFKFGVQQGFAKDHHKIT